MVNNSDCNVGIKDSIKLNIPNKPEYVSVVRLTSSAIASRLIFDIEEIEDIKVAVAEACTNILENNIKEKVENLNIEFNIYDDKLCISVKGQGEEVCKGRAREIDENELKEEDLSILILQSLMDEVEIIGCEDKSTEIRMTKHIKDDAK